MIAGIDPGQTGAIAFVGNNKVVAVYDMPTMERLHGKGKMVNASELTSIIMDCKPDIAMIEAVSALPKQGVTSSFRFGESFGVLFGVLGALQVPVKLVTPQKWKKRAGLICKEKDAARTMAIMQHPEIADQLTRKKDCGRADAIMIAKHGQ
jgi:crossover junction endodeoxyribonuclease RuvC